MTARAPLYFLLIIAVLWASPCWSQTSTPSVQVFGGYSYAQKGFLYYGGGANGWNAAVDINSRKANWIGFTADFGGYYQNPYPGGHLNTWTFLFGPRIFHSVVGDSKVTIFGHALFGGAHNRDTIGGGGNTTISATSFSWAGGGGVDYRIANHFAMRGAADALYTRFSAGDNQLQPQIADWHARLSVGVVINF
jgi:hypothetical protein